MRNRAFATTTKEYFPVITSKSTVPAKEGQVYPGAAWLFQNFNLDIVEQLSLFVVGESIRQQ